MKKDSEKFAAEQAIRVFCIGKANWYMIDTINGTKASAIIYSIAETAKANNLELTIISNIYSLKSQNIRKTPIWIS